MIYKVYAKKLRRLVVVPVAAALAVDSPVQLLAARTAHSLASVARKQFDSPWFVEEDSMVGQVFAVVAVVAARSVSLVSECTHLSRDLLQGLFS